MRVGRSTTFDELGEICRNLARYHEKRDYQRRFGFVDNIKSETNEGVIASLNDVVASSFLADGDAWALTPPGLLDFDAIDLFEIPDLDISGTEISPVDLSGAQRRRHSDRYRVGRTYPAGTRWQRRRC